MDVNFSEMSLAEIINWFVNNFSAISDQYDEYYDSAEKRIRQIISADPEMAFVVATYDPFNF